MKLYIKQKIFSFRDKFYIYDEQGNNKYYVEGEIFTFGKKLHLYSLNGVEIAYIHQKLFSFLPKYYISVDGFDETEVIKEISFFKPRYYVNKLGWSVKGDFWSHNYEITDSNNIIARISKKWFTWADTYEIDIEDDKNTQIVLSVVLVIDAITAEEAATIKVSSNNKK